MIGVEMLYNKGRTDKAMECFQMNVANYPNSFDAYHTLAQAYVIAGEKALAIQNYEKALKLNPTNRLATEELKKLKQP